MRSRSRAAGRSGRARSRRRFPDPRGSLGSADGRARAEHPRRRRSPRDEAPRPPQCPQRRRRRRPLPISRGRAPGARGGAGDAPRARGAASSTSTAVRPRADPRHRRHAGRDGTVPERRAGGNGPGRSPARRARGAGSPRPRASVTPSAAPRGGSATGWSSPRAASARNPPLRTLECLVDGARGVRGAELSIVPDRAEAIADAARGALPGDVVSVLGRGNVVEAIHDRKVGDTRVAFPWCSKAPVSAPRPSRDWQGLDAPARYEGRAGRSRSATRSGGRAPR